MARPPEPNIEEIAAVLLGEYPGARFLEMLFRGEFVVDGAGAPDQRTLLFASNRMMQGLLAAQTVNCDGTFRVAPANSHPVFGIYCSRIATTGRQPITYPGMFNRNDATHASPVRSCGSSCTVTSIPDFAPDTVQADFEAASSGAFRTVFPGVTIVGAGSTTLKPCTAAFWTEGSLLGGARMLDSNK